MVQTIVGAILSFVDFNEEDHTQYTGYDDETAYREDKTDTNLAAERHLKVPDVEYGNKYDND
ncbi:hypothetical protein N0V90_010716 [Kalmusia sp. IMI 367209]|nr:hypothetical protein N0V90_010716 [Kalmusia sp. IMI 367209]